ncbi:polysaccharide deacetylase family protein [Lacihabitans sp. CCS-44]|uniref:polysaccharide deacetylase family protein n=1 Tax=Lacihabitans sp. CCS-44 TaxID=2487331 RepID=UPI0020CB95D0|nr:polysaccharide deacetylase family protein [Lacihabitans sp. CCS-44]
MTRLFEILFPKYIWRIKTAEKKIYLTFDDGPIPEVTEWVLEQLKIFNAKATFFCVGENVLKHHEIYEKVVAAGHAVGNHTQNHLKGWKTENDAYLKNFTEFQNSIEIINKAQTQLFRPPYGQLKPTQAKEILKTHKILMWSVLTRDYDKSFNAEKCLENAIRKTKSGSIVLFHDSLKAQKNLYYVLPKYLVYFSKKGYAFCAIDL